MAALVALRTDHCPPDQLDAFVRPLLAESLRRREHRQPPFSTPTCSTALRYRSRRTCASPELLGERRRAGVVLELESGVVGGADDDVRSDGVEQGRSTDDRDLLRVAEVLGGRRARALPARRHVREHPRPVRARQGTAPARDPSARARCPRCGSPAARYQCVFHGSSGSSERLARRRALRRRQGHVDAECGSASAGNGGPRADHRVSEKEHFDPRSWGRAAEAAMADAVAASAGLLVSPGAPRIS